MKYKSKCFKIIKQTDKQIIKINPTKNKMMMDIKREPLSGKIGKYTIYKILPSMTINEYK